MAALAPALVAQVIFGSPALAASGMGLVSVAPTKSFPVSPVISHYTKPTPETSAKTAAPVWPSGSATVAFAGSTAQAAGSLPVTLAPGGKRAGKASPASDSPSKASVTVEPRSAAQAAGANGVVLAVTRADGVDKPGSVSITVSYRQFQEAFGGGWNARLALVSLPACALSTPDVPACRVQHPVTFANNPKTQTLSATATLPASPATAADARGAAFESASWTTESASSASLPTPLVLALTSDTSSSAGSGGGDYTATTLKSDSGSWSGGGSADSFTWSYPISTPEVPGGLEPSLGLSYDSQSVDGLTSATNNQAGVVGDGWDLTDSYIERSYASCNQNPAGSSKTYDNCWSNDDQLTISLDGDTSTLIKDDATGTYHSTGDPGERVQYETGAVNGAHNGEYWVVTSTDGTQYYFGLNELPGYAGTDAQTNSVDTEPVYATASGQPCYQTSFPSSYCEQAYRWNLDYVVDTHSDAISYWYAKTTAYYAQDLGTTAPSTSAYTRDSVLSKIEYGQRAGAVYSSTPAGQVDLSYAGRCSTSPTGCDTSTLSSSTASNWPDVPYDLNCASGATCSMQSPTFWSEDELTGIKTSALSGTSLTPVDSWALTYALPAIVDSKDTSTPSLWLSTIKQTGLDTTAGGSTSSVPLPQVTFSGTAMQNRVDMTDGYPWITRQRLNKIVTETGETISVGYSAPGCASSTPSSDSANTMLCYPVYWTPATASDPIKDYFNKYIVTGVTEEDPTGGFGNDTIQTIYTPVGNPAWHYDDNPLTPANQRTWDQFRGYSGMVVSTGTAPDPVTQTQYTYFRGMDGDYLTSTSTRSVTVSDTRGDAAVVDSNQYAGTTYETQVFNGTAVVSDAIDTPWTSSATATHALTGGLPSQQAFLTGQAEQRVYTPLASGSTRETETDYTHDSYGRATQVNALGDVSVASQHSCTTTSYADNTSTWILDLPDEVKTVSVPCTTTPALPADAISDDLTYYDGSATLGAVPTAGDATKTQKAASYTGSTPNYVTTATTVYDEYGRDTSDADADSRTTAMAYTPATGAEPTSIKVTDPKGLVTTTAYDPLRELPTTVTNPAGHITTEQYDALGRLTAVYEPGFAAATKVPNEKFTYTVSNSAPSVVDSYTLNDDESYRLSETIYDSMLRAREVQTGTVDGNRDITDTYYNTDGWTSETTNPYYNANPVGTTLVQTKTPPETQAQPGDVPAETGYTYDGVGRETAVISYNLGNETWRTTYSYGGNFTTTIPPAGGTATTTVTNALGQQTDLIQYLAGQPTNYATDPAGDYTDTTYTYDPAGQKATETDAAGNKWSWAYNLLGQQTDAYDPDAGHSVETYDNAGQVITSTDARGKQSTYVYDKDGRKTAAYDTTSTQTLSSSNETASWVYDTVMNGMPTSSTSYSNGDTYTSSIQAYNAMGLPAATKFTLTGTDADLVPSGGYTIGYGYTFTGLPKSVIDPAMGGLPSETVTTGYNAYGVPISLAGTGSVNWNYVTAIGYDQYDHPTQYTMPTVSGSVQATLSYDAQTSALTGIETTDSTSTNPVDQLAYFYDNGSHTVSPGSGLLTKVVDKQNGTATVDTQCFTYDYAQRLSQAWTATDNCLATPSPGSSAGVGGTDAPYWQSWTYDAAGDRLTQTDHATSGVTANDTTTTYHYPTQPSSTDQPTTLTNTTATGPNAIAETASYTYDTAGNETSQTGGTPGTETYTWNDQDQLQATTSSAGTTNYAYDADGDQIVMRDPASTTLTVGDAQLNLVSGSGNVTGTRYYSVGGVTVAERTNTGAVNCLIPDRQGTDQLAIATTAAQTVTHRQYLPFGQTRGAAPTWVGGDKGYIGGQADSTTSLETLGARVYNAASGRFLSVDPVFEADDPAQIAGYDYSGNDPVTLSDPTGQRDCVDSCGSEADQDYAKAISKQAYEEQQEYYDSEAKKAENQAIDDCTSNACIERTVRNTNNAKAKLALVNEYDKQQALKSEQAAQEVLAQRALAAQQAAAAKQSHSCGFMGLSCAWHAVTNYKILGIGVSDILSTAAMVVSIVSIAIPVLAPVAFGLNVASALYSGVSGDWFGLISAVPGFGIAARVVKLEKVARDADEMYDAARQLRAADPDLMSKGARQAFGKSAASARRDAKYMNGLNNRLTVAGGIGFWGIDECLSHC
ncbi:RHS repeat domain-containing protein [Actinospica robiniae]|uniref:RHS repeat domain-containing protein n=1 Tax=Actinospica robiniae TaxID=304901 RepID=UPI0012FA6324|nr:RHS repeat-associated core domain-containing protein [Actinospica robiniae]